MSLRFTSPSIKQNCPNLFYLFPDNPIATLIAGGLYYVPIRIRTGPRWRRVWVWEDSPPQKEQLNFWVPLKDGDFLETDTMEHAELFKRDHPDLFK